MKKLLSVVLSILLAAGVFPLTTAGAGSILTFGENLVSNPGFEGEGFPGVNKSVLSFNETIVHSGSRSLKVEKPDDWACIKYPLPSVSAGQIIYYSFWMALPSDAVPGTTSGTKASTFEEYFHKDTGEFTQKKIASPSMLVPGEWVKCEGYHRIPEEIREGSFTLFLLTDGPPIKDTYYLDDVEIRIVNIDMTSMPEDRATSVPLNTPISVTFGGEIDITSINNSIATVKGASAPREETISSVTLGSDMKTVSVTLANALTYGETYTVTLKGIRSLAGENIPDIVFSFTTKTALELGLQTFYKDYGKPTEKELTTSNGLEEGTISALAGYTNNTASDKQVRIIAALYEGERLVDVSVNTQTVPAGSAATLRTDIDVPSVTGKDYILKQFIWEPTSGMQALADSKDLHVKDLTDSLGKLSQKSILNRGNIDRLVRAMKKAEAGETITIGAIGGSITEGAGASPSTERYADHIANWWRTKFPNANIVYKNAGVGATGSYLGVHRAYQEITSFNPDFVVIEYGVNDANNPTTVPHYEALIRQFLYSQNRPAVMLIFMTTGNGGGAQPTQAPIGFYYDLPMASFRDAVWPEIAAGRILWPELYADTIHPNNVGHRLVAKFVTDRLDEIFENLDSYEMPPLDTVVKPVQTPPEYYKNARVGVRDNTIELQTEGWEDHTVNYNSHWRDTYGKGWQTSTRGKTLKLRFTGTSIGVVFKCSTDTNMGRVSAKVDNRDPIILEGYNTGSGTFPNSVELARGLAPGEHTVEFTLLEEHHPNTSGTFFAIAGILVAE